MRQSSRRLWTCRTLWWLWIKTTKTTAKWIDGLNQTPTWTVPPLAIANRYLDQNSQRPKCIRHRFFHSNFDWLLRDKHAMQQQRAAVQDGQNTWVPRQDVPFDEIILFAMQRTALLVRPMFVFPRVFCMLKAAELWNGLDPSKKSRHCLESPSLVSGE